MKKNLLTDSYVPVLMLQNTIIFEHCQLIIFRNFAWCRLVGAFPIPSSSKNKAHIDMVHTHMKNKHRKRDLFMEGVGVGLHNLPNGPPLSSYSHMFVVSLSGIFPRSI